MPAYLKRTAIFLLLLLTACENQRHAADEKIVQQLVKKATDNSLPPAVRLSAALRADSIAKLSNDLHTQLACVRIAGVIYWKTDSIGKARLYFTRMMQLADSVADKESKGIALNNIGLILAERSAYDTALGYYRQSIGIFRSLGDSLRTAQGLVNMGIVYKNTGSFDSAFSSTLQAVHILENTRSERELATAYNTLGNIMKDLRRPVEAISYHEKALDLRYKLHDSIGISGSLNNIATIYRNTGQYTKALTYYQQTLALKKKLGSEKSLGVTIDNIAETYIGMKRYDLAEPYVQQALQLYGKNGDMDGYMTASDRLAKIYLARNDLEKAEEIALQTYGHAQVHDYLLRRLDNALLLEDIYIRKKDYQRAALFADRAIGLKDSVFHNALSTGISAAGFQTAEQREELTNVRIMVTDYAVTIHKQQYYIFFLVSMTVLLLAVLYLQYRLSRLRKKARERVELLMKELNHRVENNMQIISDILRLQSGMTTDTAAVNIIDSAINRIRFMSTIHGLLYQKEYTGRISMAFYLPELIASLEQAFGISNSRIFITHHAADMELPMDKAIPLGMIANELITNIYKHTWQQNSNIAVHVSFVKDADTCCFTVTDNSSQWDTALARQQKKGLGIFLTDTLVTQLKGTMTFQRKDGRNIQTVIFK